MSERKPRLDGRAIAAIVACCAVWGLGQVASKSTLADVPPLLSETDEERQLFEEGAQRQARRLERRGR